MTNKGKYERDPERVARGERHGLVKTSDAFVRGVRELYAQGEFSIHELCGQLDVPLSTMAYWLYGKYRLEAGGPIVEPKHPEHPGEDVANDMPSAERFWGKVAIGEKDECWPWQGTRQRAGHGIVKLKLPGRGWWVMTGSRAAWVLTSGAVPRGLYVCHKCDNPFCCNPNHLFLGTPKDNAQDMVAKGRSTKGRKRDLTRVARGERHGLVTHPDSYVKEMREFWATGEYTFKDLVAHSGVSWGVLSTWIYGKYRLEAGGPIHHKRQKS
jgi:hypothetical protein